MRVLIFNVLVFFFLGLSPVLPALGADEPEVQDADQSESASVPEIPHAFRETQITEYPQGDLEPWQLLRSIQRAQDEIVNGKKDAIRAYRILLLQAANWMKKLDTATWQFQKNLDAVAVYLLIGGDVQLGYKALQESRLDRPYEILLEAAIAYAEQDVRTANDLFAFVDHKLLPPSISGQVALAKSMMHSSSDLEKAYDYLNEARKLAPGTLVEEAAIRRGLRIAAEINDVDEIKRLSRTYLFRFRNSYYFNDYLRNVSYALVNVLENQNIDLIPEFQFLFAKLDRSQQIAIAEYAMRRSLIAGKHRFVEWLAADVIPKTNTDSKAHTRLMLYHLATKILESNQTKEVLSALASLQLDHLNERDQNLLKVVVAAGNSITVSEDDLLSDLVESTTPEDSKVEPKSTNDPLLQQTRRLDNQIAKLEMLVAK